MLQWKPRQVNDIETNPMECWYAVDVVANSPRLFIIIPQFPNPCGDGYSMYDSDSPELYVLFESLGGEKPKGETTERLWDEYMFKMAPCFVRAYHEFDDAAQRAALQCSSIQDLVASHVPNAKLTCPHPETYTDESGNEHVVVTRNTVNGPKFYMKPDDQDALLETWRWNRRVANDALDFIEEFEENHASSLDPKANLQDIDPEMFATSKEVADGVFIMGRSELGEGELAYVLCNFKNKLDDSLYPIRSMKYSQLQWLKDFCEKVLNEPQPRF